MKTESASAAPAAAPSAPASPLPPSGGVAESSDAKPATQQPTATKPGGSLLANSFSIKDVAPPVTASAPKVQVEAKPLTQEDLERYWNEAAEELNLKELMAAAEVHLGENNRIIDVQATETWFATDFRPHRIDVMELLRKKSGMPMLECNIIPLFISKGTLIYTAEEKYKAMVQTNPHLASLRKLFPEIDL